MMKNSKNQKNTVENLNIESNEEYVSKDIRNPNKSWLPLLKLLKNTKLPWWLYILQLIIVYYSNKFLVSITDYTGKIASGQINDPKVVNTYIALSMVVVVLGLISVFTTWVKIHFDKKIQMKTWDSFIKLPLKIYEKLVPSSLISRITQDSLIIGEVIDQFLSLFQSGSLLLMSVIQMSEYSSTLTIYVVPVVILYVLMLFFARSWIFSISYDKQDIFSKLTYYFAEKLGNVKLIKASSSELKEIEKENVINHERFKVSLRLVKYDVFLLTFQQAINLILTGLVLIVGSILVKEKEIDIGALISFYMFSLTLPSTFHMFVQTILTLIGIKGSTSVVTEISNLPEKIVEKTVNIDEINHREIQLNNITFSYEKGNNIIEDLSFNIPYGKTTAIVGPSGSGKTTVLKLIERFYKLDSGEITMGNINIEDINLDQWRKTFGYIIQNSPLLSGTIRSNITYGLDKEVSDEEIYEALKIANAHSFVRELENGLDTDIGELGNKLSGGQKQRITIARAIITNPEILLMDEASSNIDSYNEYEITENINKLMKDKTKIVVAHNISTILNADQIIVLEKGRIVGKGKHSDLLKQCPLYKRFFDLQSACSV